MEVLDRWLEVNNSPAVYQGMVYLGTSIPGILHALDAKTGTSIFQLPTGPPVFSSMAVAHGILYCGNFSGKITVIDLKTQKPIWVFESEASKQNALAITDADGSCNFENIFPSPNPYL